MSDHEDEFFEQKRAAIKSQSGIDDITIRNIAFQHARELCSESTTPRTIDDVIQIADKIAAFIKAGTVPGEQGDNQKYSEAE